ncbi:MAG: M3 family peptidase [Sphingobacteriales bacterium]|nr:MAG: M3 family peptidase [Sphingobacteriales bacterium]
MSDILITTFNTPFQAAPFEQIKTEDYLPAFKALILQAEQEIDNIVNNTAAPDYDNVIAALAYSGQDLEVLSNIFFNINSAETNDEIQKIAQDVSPLLSAHASKIAQNIPLFEKIKAVYEQQSAYNLNEEQKTLLQDTYKGFERSGALLNEADKKKLEDINKELSLKALQFGQNALAATNAYAKHITDKALLSGIPDAILAQYEEEAKERGLDGWVITLQYPSFVPLMTYADNRVLRQEIALASGKRSFDGGTYDNQALIREIIALRDQKATLLGYKNYAAYVLEERMAKTPGKVNDFLNELLEKASPYAIKEIAILKEMAAGDGITDMQSYDHAYYAEKLRKQKFDLSDEELKPYFPLAQVQEAVFGLTTTLFGHKFEALHDIQKYHPDVNTYKITENGHYKALLYVDYHPRKGKRSGAWMTSYKNQYKKDGENHRPHISVVCNFSKPTAALPSLLSFQEVTTLFHEFGHALHDVLADTQYPGLSGTSVKWDFVELPSQFLENFCYEPEFLKTFARHYKTGEVLPDEKIARIADSKNFMEGYQTMRQLGFGMLDMAYHTRAAELDDIKSFETAATAATSLYPLNAETAASPSFSHIFGGGYAAGYYSYKWAEVLDADAFQYFKENGLFNPEVAAKYKILLSSGGTKDPMELFKAFRGSEPKVESLLKRAFG